MRILLIGRDGVQIGGLLSSGRMDSHESIPAVLLPTPDYSNGMARISLSLTGEGVRLGEDGLPRDILLWRDGVTKTTKGTFRLTDRARKMVWDDWQKRMAGVLSPDGEGPGSFDYDHDEFREHLPGYEKRSAGSFHLTLDGKDFWLTDCRFTELAASLIRKKEKRSTSGAFYFDPKTGEFTSLINVGLTNVPATYGQPLLASNAKPGVIFVPPSDSGRTVIQVPDVVLSAAALDALGRGDLRAAGQALLTDAASLSLPDGTTDSAPNDIPTASPEPHQQKDIGVVEHARYPLIFTEGWVRDEAAQRVRQWASLDGSGNWDKVNLAKLAQAHTYVLRDGGSPECYLLLHHDVDNHGQLVTVEEGVEEACRDFAAMMLIGNPTIPREAWPAVKAHLAAHAHEFGEKAPWEDGAETSAVKRPSMVVQSLILSKQRFKAAADAKAWCKSHGYKTAVDETEESYRFRQREPSEFKADTFRTITLDDGIKAVVGHLKGAKAAPVTTSQRLGMYSEMNPHALAAARMRHLGEAFPVLHALKRHAAMGKHAELEQHYGGHLEQMVKHSEHLAKHAAAMGETIPGLPPERLSAELPQHLAEMHPHHLMAMRLEQCAAEMVMDAALMSAAKLGAAELGAGYQAHMTATGDHLKRVAEHLMRHGADAGTLSILDANPAQQLAQVVSYLGATSANEVLPLLVDQRAMLETAQKTALSAVNLAGSDVKAARLAKIASLQKANLLSPVDAQKAQGIDPVTGQEVGAPWSLSVLDAIEKRGAARLSHVVEGQPLTPPPSNAPIPAPAQLSGGAGQDSQKLALLKAMNPGKTEAELLAQLEATKSLPRGPGGSTVEE